VDPRAGLDDMKKYKVLTLSGLDRPARSLFLACQYLNSEMNLRQYDDQNWFKVQSVPVLPFD
jgi:hypothetical protein